jgi:AcrR family transcriptional regulator
MGRWQPDARERMTRAAMELFAERGFAHTTAGDIAERAGVTERTFFRYFTDKREVLFDGSEALTSAAHAATLAAPPDASLFDAALAGMVAAASLLEDRHERAVRRSRIIADNPTLQERELLKMASLTEATAGALRSRGGREPAATLAAHSAVTVFQIAFARWVSAKRPSPLSTEISRTATELRAVT